MPFLSTTTNTSTTTTATRGVVVYQGQWQPAVQTDYRLLAGSLSSSSVLQSFELTSAVAAAAAAPVMTPCNRQKKL